MVIEMKSALLTIDLDAILYNYRHLKCFYKKNIIAVLKDDAYGFGLLEVANTLKYEKDVIFAVSYIDEIIKLRKANINNEILYLNFFDEQDLDIIKQYDVTVVISNLKQLLLLKNQNIKFHLKFNCYMNRLGLYDYEVDEVINEINNNSKSYNLKGVMSHFSNDDKDNKAYSKFKDLISKINSKDLIIHCFASSSLKHIENNISNYIRVGIKLYGIGDRNMFLENTIYLTSKILTIKKIKENNHVGYDNTFLTPSNGFLYILPIGYGQGWGDFKISMFYYDHLIM